MNTLEDRIARLERRNRFLQCFVIVAFVGAALMGFNYSPQEEMSTRELKIISKSGRTVAVIGSDDDGGLVKIFDKSGQLTSFLMCTGTGGAVAVYQGGNLKPFASLSATESGGHLSINNKLGASAAAITVLDNRGGIVGTFKPDGEEIMWTSPSE